MAGPSFDLFYKVGLIKITIMKKVSDNTGVHDVADRLPAAKYRLDFFW